MDEVLTATLRDAVLDRLNYLHALVEQVDVASKAALAESEISRLATAWQRLLDHHTPDPRGQCSQCSTRWRRSKCTVWPVAHQYLIADDTPRDAAPDRPGGRHAQRVLAPVQQPSGG